MALIGIEKHFSICDYTKQNYEGCGRQNGCLKMIVS
jgi:hypothetical protein